jgi:opacity protein-like surface antigen
MFLFAAALAAAAVSAAQAQDAAPATPPKCLRTTDIQNTTTPNDKTILFHMNNGKVWRSDLRGGCSGLTFNGFRYDLTPPNEICGNQQIIHVLRTHAVCALGAFTEVPKTPAPHM